MAEISANKRIAKNSLMLYFRQILIMGVSLYTVRVVLDTLGAVDYGIYNVVAGVVTMFSFLSGAMATASQRYFSFDLGKKDYEQLKKTFSVSFIIYIVIAVIVVLLAETVGLWFVYTKLIIPANRVIAARWIYHASIISFVFTILTTPYMALIIAHEDMTIYAYVSILEVVLKLAVVFILPLFGTDKLILYGILMAVVVIINTTVYRTICRRKYEESRTKLQWDKPLFKELLSYTGWNMFGASVGVFKFHAVNIVLNQFFNPVVIAARGIASQVNAAVNSFAQSFSTAVRPQIIKSYAAGKKEEMNELVYRSCKGTFFLMYLFTLPLCLEMPFILQLWLKTPPEYAVLFTQLALIDVLIDSINYPLMTAAQATGKIKLYQSVVGGVLLLNFPLAFLFCSLGFPAVFVFYISIGITICAGIVRLYILKKLLIFSILNFSLKVYIPILLSIVTSLGILLAFKHIQGEGFLSFLFITIMSLFCSTFTFFFFSLNKAEKKIFTTMIIHKFRNNNAGNR